MAENIYKKMEFRIYFIVCIIEIINIYCKRIQCIENILYIFFNEICRKFMCLELRILKQCLENVVIFGYYNNLIKCYFVIYF